MSSEDAVTTVEFDLEEKPKVDPRDAQEKITPEHPRFKEVYGKLKDSERKIEELSKTVESLSSTTEIIDELKNHNMKLADTLDRMMEGKEKDKVVSEIDVIQSKIADLKKIRIEARKELEYEKIDNLDDEIDELKDKLRTMKLTPQTQQYDAELIEVFDNFVQENPWFLDDDIMQAAAYTIDAKLLKDSKYARNHTARYAEVKRIVEEKFKFNGRSNSKQPTFANVEGSSVKNSGGSLKSVNLSAEHVRAADLLGIAHDRYAKQLLAMGGI